MARKVACSHCGEPNDRLPQRHCAACHAKHNKQYRDRQLVKITKLTNQVKLLQREITALRDKLRQSGIEP